MLRQQILEDAEQKVLDDVVAELNRQVDLQRAGKFTSRAGQCSAEESYLILGEEVGEVARAINDRQPSKELYDELIQVASVAISWAENILMEEETNAEKW